MHKSCKNIPVCRGLSRPAASVQLLVDSQGLGQHQVGQAAPAAGGGGALLECAAGCGRRCAPAKASGGLNVAPAGLGRAAGLIARLAAGCSARPAGCLILSSHP